MTPEEAQDIYFKAYQIEYQKHRDSFTPVIQDKVNLAAYQSLIDAVRAETDREWAMKLLTQVSGCDCGYCKAP